MRSPRKAASSEASAPAPAEVPVVSIDQLRIVALREIDELVAQLHAERLVLADKFVHAIARGEILDDVNPLHSAAGRIIRAIEAARA